VPTPTAPLGTPSTARPALPHDGDGEGDERLKTHILNKFRLIEPPIPTDARNSTYTATSGSGASESTDTSRESYAASGSLSRRSVRTSASSESFGSLAPDRSLTARLHRHVRNASTTSSSSALSAVGSATATLRAAVSWGLGRPASVVSDAPETQPAPWHNYNIRYDKDGREIPDLTPRPQAAPVEESWFEPSTPVAEGEARLQRVGTLVRKWKRI
jgi:hypothetical protein